MFFTEYQKIYRKVVNKPTVAVFCALLPLLNVKFDSEVNNKVGDMVQVKVTEGILDGEKITNEICGTYYSFKGIPYASPPVGNLRFKVGEMINNHQIH